MKAYIISKKKVRSGTKMSGQKAYKTLTSAKRAAKRGHVKNAHVYEVKLL